MSVPLSTRRSLGRAVIALVLVGVLGLLAGCGSGDDTAGDGSSQGVSPPDVSATGSPSSTDPATASDSPSSTAAPTATPTPYRTTAIAHTMPWTDKDADFGYVTKATMVGSAVQITFDRATWLLADQVAAWNKANPSHQVEQADDYAIGNVSTRVRTFVLRPGAKVFGSVILSDQPEPKRITVAQFVARIQAAGDPVTCWLYHQYGGLTGDVVQLEEQYRP